MDIDVMHDVDAQAAAKPRLLIADDSVTVRKVVELTFADEGIDVTAVGSGEEAMQRFVEIEPDIVLLDVNMPDPTGYHICEMIKQDEATQHIPVLLLVGSFEPFDQDQAERVGADGFIVKPFQSIRDLVARVNELLGPGKQPVLPKAETADIENLYQKSFEPAEAAGEETQDIFLGEAGFDDEIIEMSHPSDAALEPYPIGTDPDLSGHDIDLFKAAESDEADPLSGVDWFARPADGPADDMSSSWRTDPVDETPGLDLDEVDTLRDIDVEESSAEPELIEEPEPAEEPEPEQVYQMPEETQEMPLERVSDEITDEREEEAPTAEHYEQPAAQPEEPVQEVPPPTEVQEPSDELIELVARRVIEKLSDNVVREVARETVPQIAEKLIREALSDTREK
jgi:CheY-like chemotaxis protein